MNTPMGTIQWNVGEEIHLDRITNFDADTFLEEHPDLQAEVRIGEGRHIAEAADKVRMLDRSIRQREKLLREGRTDSEGAERIKTAIDRAKVDARKIRKVLDSHANL